MGSFSVQALKKFRFFSGALFIFLVLSAVSCAHTDPAVELEEKKMQEEKIKELIAQSNEDMKQDLKLFIREEVLPKVQGLNYVPQEVQDKQNKAKKVASGRVVLGRVEWVTVSSQNIRVKARVDSGAATSSIHAVKIEEKLLDGKKYVQFETFDEENKPYVLLKEVIKSARIKSATGGMEKRYVVNMKIKIGNQDHDIKVNLTDREHMKYKFLVGRNLLIGNFVVDVSQSRLLGK